MDYLQRARHIQELQKLVQQEHLQHIMNSKKQELFQQNIQVIIDIQKANTMNNIYLLMNGLYSI